MLTTADLELEINLSKLRMTSPREKYDQVLAAWRRREEKKKLEQLSTSPPT
jgi:hypothetical protein